MKTFVAKKRHPQLERPGYPAEKPLVLEEELIPAAGCAESGLQAIQITMSPFYGKPDFSALADTGSDTGIDPVSVADLLRNGFVYPPHSILSGVKVVTFNFDPHADMRDAPEFRFKFRDTDRNPDYGTSTAELVATYHRLLCDAVTRSCTPMAAPWLLQSGGKDSTTLAIAVADARPDAVCVTYRGGSEEDEVESALMVARTLGLRHETLLCDPGRAYDRYLAICARMPLLTADFALLSYVDLATEVSTDGDGVIDGVGSDNYFGLVVGWKHRCLSSLAKGFRLPRFAAELPLLGRNFELCYVLGTLQMDPIERVFPGSRFTDAEVDELLGRQVSALSKQRLDLFQAEIASAGSVDEWWAMASSIAGSVGAVAKGLYTTDALSLHSSYPFCDPTLREWVFRQVPRDQLIDTSTMTNKVLVRNHIATRFDNLPYIDRKGSFRFDLRGLAKCRFEQVHAFAADARDLLPGATGWLERNRSRLDNKYHASKFYLLAIVLPWIAARRHAVQDLAIGGMV